MGGGFWGAVAAGLAIGYALGSIPFGLLLTRQAGLGDIRTIGSGSTGATNVLRTGNKALALATVLLDALKGTVPVLLVSHWLGGDAALATAFGAVVGHCFPVWLRFQGGKGVATFIGALLGLDWRAVVVFAVIWLLAAFATRISAVGGLSATLISALVPWWFGDGRTTLVLLAMVAVVWWRHRANIGRLISGTENRFGKG